MEELYSATLEDHYSELAYHYSRSGNTQKAIEYLHLAGQQAVQRSANDEAITHLAQALEMLITLPETPARAPTRTRPAALLGPPLKNRKSWAAAEVGRAYERALELYQQLGRGEHLVPVLHGLWEIYQSRADHRRARDIVTEILKYAQEKGDPSLLVIAHDVQADTLMWLGEFPVAREHAEAGIRLCKTHSNIMPSRSSMGVTTQDWFVIVMLPYPSGR